MARKFGLITSVTGLTAGFVVNDLTFAESVEQAEARATNGAVTDLSAYSRKTTLTASGVLDDASGTLCRAGSKLTIDGKDYLITSVNKKESNTAFVTVDITAETADSAVITPIAESSSSSSSSSI